MSKAFDTLDHDILLQKNSFYGVQNTSLNLFKSYLSEISQFVSRVGNISNFKSINMQSSITDNINIELDNICDWLAVNKLSLNASKSNYMIFHHRQKNINPLQNQF